MKLKSLSSMLPFVAYLTNEIAKLGYIGDYILYLNIVSDNIYSAVLLYIWIVQGFTRIFIET